ncbi:MAG: hypothetical protein SPF89_03695 [Sphaerochaetaceae bacterium]|nr:hypothetical protein [Spirochaetales bacterium]MDY5499188.1 hypothetical protein [Sphaerochaetaceae bacterium]
MILYGMIALLALIGCDDKALRTEPEQTEAEVKLCLSCDAFQEKSILPAGQTLAIATYDISATGPGGATLTLSGEEENGSHTINLGHLAIGGWHLEATARNAEGTALAQGSTDVVFTSKTKVAELPLNRMAGAGNLSVRVTWAKDQVNKADFQLVATLKNQEGGTIAITPEVKEGEATITKDGLPSGSYVLALELLTEGTHASGATSAIRIVDGALSGGEIALEIGDRSNVFSLTIKNDTSLPILAKVRSAPEVVTAQSPQVTLTAEPTNLASLGLRKEDLSYQWYHEGTLIAGANTASLLLKDKKLGSHRYDVVITSGKPGSIGSVSVTVNYPVD